MSEQELQGEFLETFGVPAGPTNGLEALSKAALWREMPLHGLRQVAESVFVRRACGQECQARQLKAWGERDAVLERLLCSLCCLTVG